MWRAILCICGFWNSNYNISRSYLGDELLRRGRRRSVEAGGGAAFQRTRVYNTLLYPQRRLFDKVCVRRPRSSLINSPTFRDGQTDECGDILCTVVVTMIIWRRAVVCTFVVLLRFRPENLSRVGTESSEARSGGGLVVLYYIIPTCRLLVILKIYLEFWKIVWFFNVFFSLHRF